MRAGNHVGDEGSTTSPNGLFSEELMFIFTEVGDQSVEASQTVLDTAVADRTCVPVLGVHLGADTS